MKCNNNSHKPFLHIIGSGVDVVGLLCTLSLAGCGGDGTLEIPSGEKPSTVTAFNFNADNTVSAAHAAASAMSFFPRYTPIGQEVLATLAASNPANSPFDLAMCANTGHSMLSWIDGDHSGGLSMGDAASLQFINCDIDGNGATTTGTVKFGVTSVDTDPLPNAADLNVSVNLTVTNAPDTTTFIANFGATSSTSNNTNYTNVYKSAASSSQTLTVTQNGITLFQFGCFNVIQAFSLADDAGTYALSPSGIINASGSIMSLTRGSQLTFVSNRMESGTAHLLSSSVPECAAVGAPNGVGDSDGSYIQMEALGGGNLRLHTFDITNDEVATTDIAWDALLK
jgi:predicted small lipoprotein YifL